MAKELTDLRERGVFRTVEEEDRDAQVIRMKWVLEWKTLEREPEDEGKKKLCVTHHEGELRQAKKSLFSVNSVEKMRLTGSVRKRKLS